MPCPTPTPVWLAGADSTPCLRRRRLRQQLLQQQHQQIGLAMLLPLLTCGPQGKRSALSEHSWRACGCRKATLTASSKSAWDELVLCWCITSCGADELSVAGLTFFRQANSCSVQSRTMFAANVGCRRLECRCIASKMLKWRWEDGTCDGTASKNSRRRKPSTILQTGL